MSFSLNDLVDIFPIDADAKVFGLEEIAWLVTAINLKVPYAVNNRVIATLVNDFKVDLEEANQSIDDEGFSKMFEKAAEAVKAIGSQESHASQ
jgi:hypothetical protein